MNIQDYCYHTYSRWTGKEVLCAVCALHVGFDFPPQGSPAYNAFRGVFETMRYIQWMRNIAGFNRPRAVTTTMTVGRTNEDYDIAL